MFAQCNCDPYTGPFDELDIPGGNASGVLGGLVGYPLLVNKELNITGNLIIDADIGFINCRIAMAPGTSITVNSTRTLKLKNNTYVAANTTMWNGIVVMADGEIEVEKSTIAHAYDGIYIDNNLTADASYKIFNGSLFCNNEEGLVIDEYTGGVHPGLVEDTKFCAPVLIAPLAGETGDDGIRVFGINGTSSINFGNGALITPTSGFNTFENIKEGIHADRANIVVKNNFFNIIQRTPCNGYGVYGRSEPATVATADNYIENVKYGIYVDDDSPFQFLTMTGIYYFTVMEKQFGIKTMR